MKWLRQNWRKLGGAACGCASAIVAVTVSVEAGAALGAACTGLFGAQADASRKYADQLVAQLRQAGLMPKPPGEK